MYFDIVSARAAQGSGIRMGALVLEAHAAIASAEIAMPNCLFIGGSLR
jgi:hypothetical protein